MEREGGREGENEKCGRESGRGKERVRGNGGWKRSEGRMKWRKERE